METRFRKQVTEKAGLVPPEVWQLIVSFLTPYEAVRAALVCSEFAAISTPAAQQSCRRLWPQHKERLGASGPQRSGNCCDLQATSGNSTLFHVC